MKFLSSCALACSSFLIATATCQSVGAAVDTTSGIVLGHPARNVAGVSEYLGIRYGRPADGERRFMPPVPYESRETYVADDWRERLGADFDASACPFTPAPPLAYPGKSRNFDKIYGKFLGQGNKTFSEDCLALNVWTKNPDPQKLKPVLVFIHGGRFATGTANITHYQGQYVADTGDVVVVTINYRLHVLGFSGAPDLVQNTGILDQRLALEWTRSNIRAFGGDPNRVILSGQSVGGLSVDYHAFAWPSDPIASSLFAMSGTAASVQPNTPELSQSYWYNLSSIVGCPGEGDAVPCMQNKTWQALLAGIAKLPSAPSKALLQPQFQETVDGKVVFSDYAARGRAGKFAKIPLLLGNTDLESGFYAIGAFATRRNFTAAQQRVFNLQGFTCATAISAAWRTKYDIPVYRYRYFGDFENLRLYPGSGAYHGADLNMWYGVAEDVSEEANNAIEDATSSYMIKVLTTFAKDPMEGLHVLGWPRYVDKVQATLRCALSSYLPDGWDPSCRQTLARLGFNNQTTVSFVNPQTYDYPCPAFGGDTGLAMGAM